MNIVFEQGNRRIVEVNGQYIPQRGMALRATSHAPVSYGWEACEVRRDTSSPFLKYVSKSFKSLNGAKKYLEQCR